MKRRSFIAFSGLGIIGAAFGRAVPVTGQSKLVVRSQRPFELSEATIQHLQEGMASGAITARAIAEYYLERIAALDRNGPKINSVIEVNPDTLSIADALDREREERGPRGPMHGIPVLLKDNIDTADRMLTTAGSLALTDSPAPRDAFLVERLRAAGAVILGKTNLSEWANFRSSHSTSGWSARGGQTRNPYVLDRNPCGSSSGSAASVSADLCAVAVGTETDGSIVCPSSSCGIVGIKPTLGLVSRTGVIPIAHSQDTAGPMARTVADAAILLGALCGSDPDDPAPSGFQPHFGIDYTQFLDPDGLRGARIGVARNFFGFDDRVDELMEKALKDMEGFGAEIVDPADIPFDSELGDSEFEVLLYEFKADLNRYLQTRRPNARIQTLQDLITFNREHAREEMSFFGQDIFERAEEKGPLTSPDYLAALAKNHRLTRDEGIDAVIDANRLDAVVAPAGGPAWVTDLVNGDHFIGGSSSPAAVAGYPSITVPAGFIHGLPVGISFIGKAYTEPVLIRLAYAYEQATKHRVPPAFSSTIE
jgi:amidase